MSAPSTGLEGVPAEIFYDNPKTVVLGPGRGGHAHRVESALLGLLNALPSHVVTDSGLLLPGAAPCSQTLADLRQRDSLLSPPPLDHRPAGGACLEHQVFPVLPLHSDKNRGRLTVARHHNAFFLRGIHALVKTFRSSSLTS